MNPMKRWDEFQSLAELAEEYDGTYHLLLDRLNRLKTDPAADRFELRMLKDMVKTTRKIRNTCRDYYKKGALLDDAYTVRYTLQRIPRRPAGVAAGNRGNKRRSAPEAVAKPDPRHSNRIDPSAAADLAALFARGSIRPSHRSEAGGAREYSNEN